MKTTLVIMAAGLGSRYGGNKQVDGLGPHGEILMQYSIYDAMKAGFNKLVFIIKPQYQEVIEHFCRGLKGMEVEYVYQDFSGLPASFLLPSERTKPLGTVHAVLCAKDVVKEPFAVINADDFYGASAYRTMHDYLVGMKSGQAAMVAYRLKNTVSMNGAVTRGICRVRCGRLCGVTETYHITVDETGKIYDADSGVLDGEALVSMNMWGFMPDIFEEMQKDFEAFLTQIPEGNLTAEYALPTMVDHMIRAKTLSVRVLSTDAVWFGVTYQEDRGTVTAELQKMHDGNQYPTPLF